MRKQRTFSFIIFLFIIFFNNSDNVVILCQVTLWFLGNDKKNKNSKKATKKWLKNFVRFFFFHTTKIFGHFLVLFFEFLFFLAIPKNQGVNRVEKATNFFGIQFVTFFVFATSGAYLNQIGQSWQNMVPFHNTNILLTFYRFFFR